VNNTETKAKGLTILVIMVAMCALVASASAPPTPFMIYGYVSYENGGACNNPTVNINNTNTSNEWSTEIKTNASYNYYQLMLANGTDVNASEMLRFNVTSSTGNQSNITEHTVTQENITDGGIFNFNITLEAPPEVVINEIMYNPPSDIGKDYDYEWIELHNTKATSVDVSGWNLTTNNNTKSMIMPAGTSIEANGYLVIARNETAFELYYHWVNKSLVITNKSGNMELVNTRPNMIILKNSTGAEIDNITYNPLWDADGNGYTLERNSEWNQSNSYSGTPLDTNSIVDLEPVILDYEPHDTNPTNNSGGTMTFRVKANQNVNVTWYINESLVNTANISVDTDTWANYTNESAKEGYWNVSAIVTNANGTDMQTWWWTVEKTVVGTTFTVSLPTGRDYAIFEPENSTATNVPPGGQNSSTAFYNVTNTGNVNLSIGMQLNATVSNILLKAGTDNDPGGAKEVNTTLVTIFSSLEQWDSVEIWIWSDFSHAIEQQTNKTLSINVTQA
jgi:hypothetical protein